MKPDDGYREFQDVTFQEIKDRERMASRATVEEFVRYAQTKGFTIDHLVKLTESGMSGAELWNAVHAQ